ncbi:MAG: aminomethyltransferase family protein [Rhodobacteraceae bacterium]|nr:aminomethyltransferase family protein [Paracoccaceae bacterium]
MNELLHFRTPLRTTPFHPRTAALNRLNRWSPWAGYTTALCYGDTAMEHSAIRNAASLYDLCPMVKYRITGPQAEAFLDRLTVRSVARLAPGAAQYTIWCDDEGRLLDDGTLFRHGPQDFLLTCQERHLPWLLDSAAGYDVAIADVTADVAALALQGPCAAWVLREAGFDVAALAPFRLADFPFDEDRITISRTGFTGDLGYELWMKPWQALPLWDLLMRAGAPRGLRPVGSEALDIARIEAGFLLTNADFVPADQAVREDRVRSPFELGLDWLIDWEKGHFTGRRALLAERDGGTSNWALVGLDVEGNISAAGSLLYLDRRHEAGHVTSACWSPTLKRSIALAQIRRPFDRIDRLWVEIYALRELQYAKLMMRVRPAPRPFFVHPRRRATPPGDW